MKKLSLLLSVTIVACNVQAQKDLRPVDQVNPFIGSVNCRWFFFTPAALPFGMARLGPHTNSHYGNPSGWEPVGYDYRDHSIEGFGHFHEFQIGGIVLMPLTGKLRTTPGDTVKHHTGYRSDFDRNTEKSMPGYYSVFLKDHQVKAELTATKRVGYHRYTFPKGKQKYIIIDVGNRQGESGMVLEAFVQKNGSYEIEGGVTTLPEYVRGWDSTSRVKMFFVARFEKPVRHFGTFIGKETSEGNSRAEGPGCGMYVTLDPNDQGPVIVKVGLSYISTENARQNLDVEARGLSFDGCRQKAVETWNENLSRVEVKGGSSEDRTKFYTGLYHAISGRGISSDINGQYTKIGGGIGHIPLVKGVPSYSHYNSDATWGGFWNFFQLWGLVYPEELSGYIRSSLDHYNDIGWLPDGVAAGAFTPGMPSNFLGLCIASAYNRHIRDFDKDLAWQAAWKNEMEWKDRPAGVGKYDLEEFVTNGYIPIEHTFKGWKFSGSHTLEYAYSSWGVGQFAKAIGKEEQYERLNKMGLAYRNLIDPAYNMVHAKDKNGEFVKDFTLTQVWNGFQEGNSWQYSWYAPQDVKGLIGIMGKEQFNLRLDSIFTQSAKNLFGGGKVVNSFSGLEAIYNHGNQPCLHTSYLFNFSGKPWLTQKWVRQIMNVFYGDEPLHGYGYGQDEDQGQLGAWYVLSGIGLFDVQGGASLHPTMQLTSSPFDRITIRLNKNYFPGEKFQIIVRNNKPGNVYIQSAKVNGATLNKPWIYFDEIMKGGTLEYEVGANPNKQWGSAPGSAPPANY